MKRTALASLMLTFALVSPTLAEEARWNELANLPFQQDYPTEETARRLTDELLFERGIQSYLCFASHQHVGDEAGVGSPFWCGLQRPTSVEGTSERENPCHDASLWRHRGFRGDRFQVRACPQN